GLVLAAERGARERDRAIGRGLLVAIAELEAQFERSLRLLVSFVRAPEHQVALRAPAAQLGDDVAPRDQRERVRQDLVVTLERGVEMALLELDVAQVLEAKKLGTGFADFTFRLRTGLHVLHGLRKLSSVNADRRLEQMNVLNMRGVSSADQE